jgi:hypothetical protein
LSKKIIMHLKKEETKEKYGIAEQLFIENKYTSVQTLCKDLKIDQGNFSNYMKSKGYIMRRKSKVNDELFDNIDTEEKAYWLGFLYADGNVYTSSEKYRVVNRIEIGLSIKDKTHLYKFIDFLEGDISMLKLRQKTNACRVSFSSKYMVNALIDKGCIQKKSLVLVFPNSEIIPDEFIFHFIRGYFDGDGSISVKNCQLQVSLLGTYEFLNKVCTVLNINPNHAIRKDKRHSGNTYSIYFSAEKARLLGVLMYKNSTIFLDRKKEKFDDILYNCRSGKKFLELLEGNIGEGCDANTEIS